MIRLNDFCNTINGNATVRVYDAKSVDVIFDNISVYELKRQLRNLFRDGYDNVTRVYFFDDDVDMIIDIL